LCLYFATKKTQHNANDIHNKIKFKMQLFFNISWVKKANEWIFEINMRIIISRNEIESLKFLYCKKIKRQVVIKVSRSKFFFKFHTRLVEKSKHDRNEEEHNIHFPCKSKGTSSWCTGVLLWREKSATSKLCKEQRFIRVKRRRKKSRHKISHRKWKFMMLLFRSSITSLLLFRVASLVASEWENFKLHCLFYGRTFWKNIIHK
jgi:hypothetical protein